MLGQQLFSKEKYKGLVVLCHCLSIILLLASEFTTECFFLFLTDITVCKHAYIHIELCLFFQTKRLHRPQHLAVRVSSHKFDTKFLSRSPSTILSKISTFYRCSILSPICSVDDFCDFFYGCSYSMAPMSTLGRTGDSSDGSPAAIQGEPEHNL